MGDIDFKWDGGTIDSPDQFGAMCAQYSRECKKLEALDEERRDRILNLMSNMLAIALQKVAIDEFGNTDEESTREVLCKRYAQTTSQEHWHRFMSAAKQYFLALGLTENQCRAIIEYFDAFPMAMLEFWVELARPWRLFPTAQGQSVASALTDLMREVEA
jgi:hypothetical protein